MASPLLPIRVGSPLKRKAEDGTHRSSPQRKKEKLEKTEQVFMLSLKENAPSHSRLVGMGLRHFVPHAEEGAPPKMGPVEEGYSSDEELPEHPWRPTVFSRKQRVPVGSVTLPNCERNIKGGFLIEKVHTTVRKWYRKFLDQIRGEKPGARELAITIPDVKQGHLSIKSARDWFLTLGGWKGMIPSLEVKGYAFYKRQGQKFTSVDVFGNGMTFPINNHRMHVPAGFKIGNFEVTQSWTPSQGMWVSVFKTDLSYNQITKAIAEIKKNFLVTDSQIAQLQLSALNRSPQIEEFLNDNDKKNRLEIVQFLDYLNGLMFGMEASGLNASLAISLMILDLIADGKLSYEKAFKVNEDGGIYPYACGGNNMGTFKAREHLVVESMDPHKTHSMRAYRHSPSISPVACKEAITIADWLKNNGVIQKGISHISQIKRITDCVEDLLCFYYTPDADRNYTVKKFHRA